MTVSAVKGRFRRKRVARAITKRKVVEMSVTMTIMLP